MSQKPKFISDEEMAKIDGQSAKPTGFISDADMATIEQPKKSTFSKVIDTLGYPGRVTRTALAALISPKYNASDVAEQLGTLQDVENQKKQAPTGDNLLDIANESIKLGPIGVNPNFKGPKLESPGLAEALLGKRVQNKNELSFSNGKTKITENDGIYGPAGFGVEMVADLSNLIGLGGASKASKLGKGAKIAEGVVNTEKAAQAASDAGKIAPNIIENGAELIGKSVPMAGETAGALTQKNIIEMANFGGPKANSKEIIEATKRLGAEATPGMLTNNEIARGLESSLEQSPSLAGIMVRKNVKKVRNAIEKASESLVENTSSFTKFETGEAVKSGILEKIAQRYAPIAEKFNQLRESTAFIEVPSKSKDALARNFMNIKKVQLAPGSSWATKAEQYGNYLKNAKSVDDIKSLRGIVGKELKATANDNEYQVLSSIYGSLTRLEENTIKRAAIAQARTSSEGLQIGKQMISDLRDAKAGYHGLHNDLSEVSQVTGLKKTKTVEDFIELIDNVPSEQIGDKLFKTNNLKALNTIEKQFPAEFSLLRQQKVTELAEKAMIKGQVDPGKLVKAARQMGPEVIKKIFGGNADNVIKDIETVLNNTPSKIGPSGTPQGLAFMEILRPVFNVQEAGRYGLYKKLANPTIPIGQVVNASKKATIPFKKAGEVSVQGLSDLILGAATVGKGIDYLDRINQGK
jgi:hypothetical protein